MSAKHPFHDTRIDALLALARPGGGGGSSVGFISVLNTAALAAFPVAGLVEGQPAAIRDRASLWAYNPQDSSPADGWHIPSATGPGCWTYVGAFDGPTQANQLTWFIDPQNSTGTASDDNDGLTQATALPTFAEVVRRCGDVQPFTDASSIVVQFLSSQLTGSDPVVFRPTSANSAGTAITYGGVLPTPAFTGTLATVTAKDNSTPPGNPLAATFTAASGAIAQFMVLVNTDRGNSRCIVERNTSGATWQLTQPQVPWSGSGLYFPSEVNTWAPGDHITGFVPLSANIVDVTTTPQDSVSSPTAVFQLTCVDQSGIGADVLQFSGQLIDCVVRRSLNCVTASVILVAGNCALLGRDLLGADSINIFGGILGNVGVIDVELQINNDVIAWNSSAVILGLDGPVHIESMCVDIIQTRLNAANYGIENNLFGPLYGSGSLDVWGNFIYSPSFTAASQLLLAPVTMRGSTTAYSLATAAGSTAVHGAITVTAANLDAAAGAAGFGGYAFGSGALLSNGNQP